METNKNEYKPYDVVEYKFSHQDSVKTAMLTRKEVDGWFAYDFSLTEEWHDGKPVSGRIWLHPSDIVRLVKSHIPGKY